ncbi:MAG: tRNA threonylcarbamoyladenosine dehydratase [Bacteroidetes bacterium]|nr:tRNA threonylcarbamoyladenosine dehydratase [Bacteroidota bacterium]
MIPIADEWLSRTELLLGSEKLEQLKKARVLVVGLGGVGAVAAEMICRAGVGNMVIVDGDCVQESNRNRQIPALKSTTGQKKTVVLAERLLDINPELNLFAISEFLEEDLIKEIVKIPFDFVVDAIDTLTPKLDLIFHCLENKLKIVSSMGAGGKLDPTQVQIDDLFKTHNCNFAQEIRKRLRKKGIKSGVQAVFSPEMVAKESKIITETELFKKSIVGTISYMPIIFGCNCASVVIRDLVSKYNKKAVRV